MFRDALSLLRGSVLGFNAAFLIVASPEHSSAEWYSAVHWRAPLTRPRQAFGVCLGLGGGLGATVSSVGELAHRYLGATRIHGARTAADSRRISDRFFFFGRATNPAVTPRDLGSRHGGADLRRRGHPRRSLWLIASMIFLSCLPTMEFWYTSLRCSRTVVIHRSGCRTALIGRCRDFPGPVRIRLSTRSGGTPRNRPAVRRIGIGGLILIDLSLTRGLLVLVWRYLDSEMARVQPAPYYISRYFGVRAFGHSMRTYAAASIARWSRSVRHGQSVRGHAFVRRAALKVSRWLSPLQSHAWRFWVVRLHGEYADLARVVQDPTGKFMDQNRCIDAVQTAADSRRDTCHRFVMPGMQRGWCRDGMPDERNGRLLSRARLPAASRSSSRGVRS